MHRLFVYAKYIDSGLCYYNIAKDCLHAQRHNASTDALNARRITKTFGRVSRGCF